MVYLGTNAFNFSQRLALCSKTLTREHNRISHVDKKILLEIQTCDVISWQELQKKGQILFWWEELRKENTLDLYPFNSQS